MYLQLAFVLIRNSSRDSTTHTARERKQQRFSSQFFKNPKKSFLIITHYQKLLDYIHPDFVHVMRNGKIVKSGDISLATEIEVSGYQNF